VLSALGDEGDSEDESPQDESAGGSGDGDNSEGEGEPEDDDVPDQYNILFLFKDDDGMPYRQTRYIAKFADGSQVQGVTDSEGNTESFNTDEEAQDIDVRLLSQNIDMILGGVNE